MGANSEGMDQRFLLCEGNVEVWGATIEDAMQTSQDEPLVVLDDRDIVLTKSSSFYILRKTLDLLRAKDSSGKIIDDVNALLSEVVLNNMKLDDQIFLDLEMAKQSQELVEEILKKIIHLSLSEFAKKGELYHLPEGTPFFRAVENWLNRNFQKYSLYALSPKVKKVEDEFDEIFGVRFKYELKGEIPLEFYHIGYLCSRIWVEMESLIFSYGDIEKGFNNLAEIGKSIFHSRVENLIASFRNRVDMKEIENLSDFGIRNFEKLSISFIEKSNDKKTEILECTESNVTAYLKEKCQSPFLLGFRRGKSLYMDSIWIISEQKNAYQVMAKALDSREEALMLFKAVVENLFIDGEIFDCETHPDFKKYQMASKTGEIAKKLRPFLKKLGAKLNSVQRGDFKKGNFFKAPKYQFSIPIPVVLITI